jgi:hypothetical protein
MRHFKRISTTIEPSALLREIERQPELWREITMRQDYEGSAHADTEAIFLRAPASVADILNELNCVDMPAIEKLSPTLVGVIHPLAYHVGIREFGRAMLVNLKAGGKITPHKDEGAYARYYARFHYVLTSTPECRFTVGDETVHMAPGELWWFNHQVEHHVENDGPDRVHLIVDATAPGYTGALRSAVSDLTLTDEQLVEVTHKKRPDRAVSRVT